MNLSFRAQSRNLPIRASVWMYLTGVEIPLLFLFLLPLCASAPLPAFGKDFKECPLTRGHENQARISCSQSILDHHEARDIFGRRVADTYVIVQTRIRNLSDTNDYVLHDIRLGYRETAVSGRPTALVRGVAEKGQVLDLRNILTRTIDATSIVLPAITQFVGGSWPLIISIFQGPAAQGVRIISPDLTLNQMTRLGDHSFNNPVVITRNNSVFVVTFLSQRVFFGEEERDQFRQAEAALFEPFQQQLYVEIVGSHVAEVEP